MSADTASAHAAGGSGTRRVIFYPDESDSEGGSCLSVLVC